MINRIALAASQARTDFENQDIPYGTLGELYRIYNPGVEDIESFIEFSKEKFPLGSCGLASVYLQQMIEEGEIINGAYDSRPHTFLKIGATIVDITADQFPDGPSIHVGSMREPWSDAPPNAEE